MALGERQRLTHEPSVAALAALLALPEERLCAAQIKAARAGGDLERVKRVTGRLKELFFAAHGGSFTMAAFKHARTREDYGSSRWAGGLGVCLLRRLGRRASLHMCGR